MELEGGNWIYDGQGTHMIIDNELYLDMRLHSDENYGKICISDEYLSSQYTTVEDYLLYKYFQRFGNPTNDDLTVGSSIKEEYE